MLGFRIESTQREIVLSELFSAAPALTQYTQTPSLSICLTRIEFLALSTIQTSKMPAERAAVQQFVYFPNSVTARLTGAAAGRKRKLLLLETCRRKSPFAMLIAGRDHKRYVICVVSQRCHRWPLLIPAARGWRRKDEELKTPSQSNWHKLASVLVPNPWMCFLPSVGSCSSHSLYLYLEMTCQPKPNTFLNALLRTIQDKIMY